MAAFGVTGGMGLSSSNIYSNPKTIEAVKRQQEKERLSQHSSKEQEDKIRALNRELAGLKMELTMRRRAEERRIWHDEFQFNIMRLRMAHLFGNPYELPPEDPKRVMNEAARRIGITIPELKRKTRDKIVIAAKREVISEIYVRCPHVSLPAIAKLMDLDHTTALYHVKKSGVHVGHRPEPPSKDAVDNEELMRQMAKIVRIANKAISKKAA